MSKDDEIRRAQRAELILGDELVKEAFQKLRDLAMDEFRSAKPSDSDALTVARVRYQVTEDLLNVFAKLVRDGQYAQRQIDDKAIAMARQLKSAGVEFPVQ